MKLYDIFASLFVEFAVGMFLAGMLSIVLRPFVPDDVSLQILAAVFLVIWSLLPGILAGAGWSSGLNKIAMLVLSVIGWMFLGAALIGFGGEGIGVVGTAIIWTGVMFEIGRRSADERWIMKLLIIRRGESSPPQEEPTEDKSTWEN
jgi:hypothetical protein